MTYIILDKSAARGVPATVLANTSKKSNIDYILTTELLIEIVSGLDRDQCLRTILAGTRDMWSPPGCHCMLYEISKGVSSHSYLCAPTDRYPLNSVIDELPRGEIDRLREQDAQLARFGVNPLKENTLRAVRRLPDERKFYVWLAKHMDRRSRNGYFLGDYVDLARRNGVQYNPYFSPDRRYFTFGALHAAEAFYCDKIWRYSNAVSDPRAPDNFGRDLRYVAYLSITDGLLSLDTRMLSIAWAAWPEKRQHLYTYDSTRREIRQWRPQWDTLTT